MNISPKPMQESRDLILPTAMAASIFSLIFSLLIFIWVLHYCRFGFDLTDEGFYLNWISNPFNFSASSMQFGFLYHPLHLILKGDIAMLRQTNLSISFFLGGCAVWLMLKGSDCRPNCDVRAILQKLAISLSLASATLCSAAFNGVWLFPTPSYNSAALQGLLLVANGLLLISGPYKIRAFIGWGLVGLGGWVTFMGKPTSAAILLLVVILYLLSIKKFFVWQLFVAIGAALGLLLISSIVIDGSIIGFIKRNLDGLNMMQVLGGHPMNIDAFFNLPDLGLVKESQISFIVLVLSTFITALLFSTKTIYTSLVKSILVITIFSATIFLLFYFIPLNSIPDFQRNLLIVGVGLGGLFFLILKIPNPVNKTSIGMPGIYTFLFLIAMPYAYAFGSNNNYWIPIGCSVFFMLLAALAPVRKNLSDSKPCMNGLLIVGLGVQILSVIILSGAFANPYRNPNPLILNDAKLAIGIDGHELYINKAQKTYLATIRHLVKINGFQKGAAIIDMTGHSPGVLYFLEANVIGAPWLFGGYPGSQKFAELGLKTSKCETLLNAWLLTEPGNPASLPDATLLSFGRDRLKDYEVIGSFKTPTGSIQQILKPISVLKNNFDDGRLCGSIRNMAILSP